jgi:predicted nicotinamide N-methyase
MKKTFFIDFKKTPFLKTSQTITGLNRLNWRAELLLTRNQKAIKGKRVLDLASHDGRFSYACLKLGAKQVTGVEGRPYLVRFAKKNLKSLGYKASSFKFINDDLFNYLPKVRPGTFDTILCFGFFYHTVKQVELIEQIKRLKPKVFLLDTFIEKDLVVQDPTRRHLFLRLLRVIPKIKLDHLLQPQKTFKKMGTVTAPPSACLVFFYEDHTKESNTINPIDLIASPTKSFIELLFKTYRFKFKQLLWDEEEVDDWTALKDYQDKIRVSYLAQPK